MTHHSFLFAEISGDWHFAGYHRYGTATESNMSAVLESACVYLEAWNRKKPTKRLFEGNTTYLMRCVSNMTPRYKIVFAETLSEAQAELGHKIVQI